MQCKWCATSRGLDVGCVSSATPCPGTSSAVSSCAPPPCEEARSCSECLTRLAPTGGSCGWCRTSSYGGSRDIGCRASRNQCNFPGFSTYLETVCPVAPMLPTILWSVSAGVGLMIGCFVYIVTLKSDVRQLVLASYGLFFLSFVFYGASLFSFMISVRVVNKMNRKCCTGYCFGIHFLGYHEVTTVLAGVLTGAIMDGTIPTYYYSSGFPGMFSVMIGLPTVYGALLAFGIPRVALTGCYGRKKQKVDDDDYESINGGAHQHRDSAPLIPQASGPAHAAPAHAAPAPAAAAPPGYFPAPSYQAAAPGPQHYGDGAQPYNK